MAYIYRRWSLLWISCNISMFYNLYIHTWGKNCFVLFLFSVVWVQLKTCWRWNEGGDSYLSSPSSAVWWCLKISSWCLLWPSCTLNHRKKQKVRKLLSLPKCLWVRASLLTYLWRGLYPADWPLFSTPPFSTQEVWWDLLRGTWGQKEI